MNVISAPPKNLLQLAEALEKVDNKKIFFGRNLYLLTKKTDMPLEVIQGNVMNLFLECFNPVEYSLQSKAELERFTRAYSNYSIRMKETGLSTEAKYLLNCGEDLIESEVKSFNKHKSQSQDRFQMFLITDTDGYWGCPGAMAIRAVEAIRQRVPIVLPYSLLLSVVQAHFKEEASNQSYFEKVCMAMKELSDSLRCKIFKNKDCDLAAVIPPGCEQKLDLMAFSLKDFKALEKEAILYCEVEPYKEKRFTVEDILQTLSSKVSKHILWSGHGLLNKSAMGLLLFEVIQILSQTKDVACWDLSSCYLLGNIRQIVHKIKHLNQIILIRNGIVAESSPLHDDESVRAYFRLSNKALGKTDEKIKHFFSKASPWITGLNICNHPHVVCKDKSIVPLKFPALAEVLTEINGEPKKYENIKRLYIAIVQANAPIHLYGKIALLPGLAETNTQHLLQDVKTDLSLSEFFNSSFLYENYFPGRRKVDEREDVTSHQGNYLLMINKFQCSEGIFQGIIYYKTPADTITRLVLKDGKWSLYEPKTFFLGFEMEDEHFSEYLRMEKFLQKALIESCPSSQTWQQFQITPASFYNAVGSAFKLSEWTKTVIHQIQSLNLVLKPIPQKDGFIEIPSNPFHHCSKELLKALTFYDVKTINHLISEIEDNSCLNEALIFCINTNQTESFSYLLESSKKLMPALPELPERLILSCIGMRRPEMIKAISKQQISLGKSDNYLLNCAAAKGDIATFEAVCEIANPKDIDIENLRRRASKVNNWEIVHYIAQKLAKQ